MVSFISADGNVFFSVYVFKGIEKNDKFFISPLLLNDLIITRSKWERLYGYTSTGYLNSEIYENIIDFFCEKWNLSSNKRCLLICDQLSFHKNIDILKKSLMKGVLTIFLPTSTTHFLQPLDSLPFALLKKKFRKSSNKILKKKLFLDKKTIRNDLFKACLLSEDKSFSKKIIKEAFLKTGIFPFSRERILNNAENNIVHCSDQEIEVISKKISDSLLKALDLRKEIVSLPKIEIRKSQIFLSDELIRLSEERKRKMDEKKKKKKSKKKRRND